MASPAPGPLTQLLADARHGDAAARDRLWNAIHDELRVIARSQMAAEAPGRTLQPTALVHETYIRLFGNGPVDWANRKHFFAAAAMAMRRIRIDDARRRNRQKRGAGARQQADGEDPPCFDQDPAEVLAVDEALEKLERKQPRLAEVVTLRYFAGLSVDETAEALGVAPRTVDGDWRLAKAWLHRELSVDP